MSKRRIRWWLALGIGLLCLLVPACSETDANAERAGTRRPVAAASRRVSTADEPAGSPAPEKTAATGQPRRHPFVSMFDARARSTVSTKKAGPLTLKAILDGPLRAAIIQQGPEAHFVKEGDKIGGLTVLTILDGEVVLGAGRRKRILCLYER